MSSCRKRLLALAMASGAALSACSPRCESVATNPTIAEIVASVSEERMATNLRRLESFGTRHVLSGNLGPERGIDAARDWLVREFSSYGPRLEEISQVVSAASF